MASASPAGRAEGFRFRRLVKPEEFRQAEELQRAALGAEAAGVAGAARPVDPGPWGTRPGSVRRHLPRRLHGIDDRLGRLAPLPLLPRHRRPTRVPEPPPRLPTQVVPAGGGDAPRPLGDPVGLRSAREPERLAVRPPVRQHPERYLPHYFGQLPESGDAGTETDRLRTRWNLASSQVEARSLPRRRLRPRTGPGGRRRSRWSRRNPGRAACGCPPRWSSRGGPTAHLEIPFDLSLIRRARAGRGSGAGATPSGTVRVVLDLHYTVDDFTVVSVLRTSGAASISSTGPRAGAAGEALSRGVIGGTAVHLRWRLHGPSLAHVPYLPLRGGHRARRRRRGEPRFERDATCRRRHRQRRGITVSTTLLGILLILPFAAALGAMIFSGSGTEAYGCRGGS